MNDESQDLDEDGGQIPSMLSDAELGRSAPKRVAHEGDFDAGGARDEQHFNAKLDDSVNSKQKK
jgi:hypothetical protein